MLRELFHRLTGRAARTRIAMETFGQNSALLRAHFLSTAQQLGRPRGLTWLRLEANGEPTFANDGRRLVAILPVVATFEPQPDSELEDVPQAREPRPICVLFHFHDGWQTDGRAIFNLSAEQILASSCWQPIR